MLFFISLSLPLSLWLAGLHQEEPDLLPIEEWHTLIVHEDHTPQERAEPKARVLIWLVPSGEGIRREGAVEMGVKLTPDRG